MKINSLKLTIQDMETSDAKSVAAVMGTLFIDNDEWKKNEEGNLLLDDAGMPIPIYETINFTTALHVNRQLLSCVQALIIEALTLKNMAIAKKNGTLSHFIKAVGAQTQPKARGSSVTKIKRRK